MRAPHLRRLAPVALAVALALPGSAIAGGVRILTPQGDLNFPDIASAVAAAVEGDVLLVGEGDYGGFTIDGKSLSIWAAPSGAIVNVTSTITVRNLAAHQSVVLSGLSVAYHDWPDGVDDLPLVLADSSGWIRLQACHFEAYQGWWEWWYGYPGKAGAPGAALNGCSRVAFLGCSLLGGEGSWGYGPCMPSTCHYYPAGGGAGLAANSSRVALYDCTVRGGRGGSSQDESCCCGFGDGGAGISASGSEVFVSGCTVWGAWGGHCKIWYGSPGCGVSVDGQSVVDALDCIIGTPMGGPAKCGPGWLTLLPGTAREVLTTTIVPEFSPIDVELAGLAGDAVWLPRSQAMDHWLYLPVLSVWLIPRPLRMPRMPAVILSTGSAVATIPPLWIHRAMTHQEWILQGMFVHPAEARLGSARHVLGLSLTVGPDCDGNGTSDYVDVLFGGAPDVNHDLIPDTCQGG